MSVVTFPQSSVIVHVRSTSYPELQPAVEFTTSLYSVVVVPQLFTTLTFPVLVIVVSTKQLASKYKVVSFGKTTNGAIVSNTVIV